MWVYGLKRAMHCKLNNRPGQVVKRSYFIVKKGW
nr:MAG TPA: hypothetical protein [Caudoviricetes sp.]DAU98031.1 MAG TPA: hypothetical protein [Caudoviricetes sp.]